MPYGLRKRHADRRSTPIANFLVLGALRLTWLRSVLYGLRRHPCPKWRIIAQIFQVWDETEKMLYLILRLLVEVAITMTGSLSWS